MLLHNLHSAINISGMIKAKIDEMSTTCSTREEMRDAYNVLTENIKERDHLEDIKLDGRKILTWILENNL